MSDEGQQVNCLTCNRIEADLIHTPTSQCISCQAPKAHHRFHTKPVGFWQRLWAKVKAR